jgi:peptidyl-prolyl cis-trans isomerase-like 4
MSVVLETTLGDITIDLYYDERSITCKNFLYLCQMKYYHFCLFHSIQTNFIAQTGDPTGSGRGGESIYRQLYGEQATYFDRESKPTIKHRKRGAVSMVNNSNDQHGSQFFLTLASNLDSLDGIHTVFGEIVDGWDVLDKINIAVVDREHRPYHDIRIIHTVIIANPYEMPSTLDIPERSPSPTIERVKSSMIAFDELFDEERIQGKTDEEIKDYVEEKEAQARAQILELIGDLPEVRIFFLFVDHSVNDRHTYFTPSHR